MNIAVAPDSFKGSLTSIQASDIIAKGIKEVLPSAHVMLKPMADGGEGTVETLLNAARGERAAVECTGPLGERITAYYAIVQERTAIIECASAAGLVQVPAAKRNPDYTTTFGVGEMMKDAMDRGCTDFIIGLGGSATNDCGLGFFQAMGMQAEDSSGNTVGFFGKDLHHVKKVDLSRLDPRLKKATIKVACDVDNPVCGGKGASAVFGPQKGATPEQITEYDQSMDHYTILIETELNVSLKNIPGAGAAGGLGFAFLAAGAELVSGAQLIGEAIGVEKAIQESDLVITGEGQSDEQTLYGKAPGYISSVAKKHNVPAVLISGSTDGDLDELRKHFAGCFSIINKPLSLEECIAHADELLFEQTKQIIHFMQSVKNTTT